MNATERTMDHSSGKLSLRAGHIMEKVSLMKYGLLLFMVQVFACFGCNPPQKDSDVQLSTLLGNANKGDAAAQFNLGVMYDEGDGVPEDDAEAVKWYRKAADQGLAEAQSNLGLMYANGKGVPEDDAEAVKWYREAADQGLAGAQTNLGLMYANGRGGCGG